MTRSIRAVALITIAFALALPPAEAAPPTVWTAGSLAKITQTEPPRTGSLAELWMAKGEYESFQIVIRGPAGGLTNVNVQVTDLQGPGGATIPKSSLTLYREHYVYVRTPSVTSTSRNPSLGAGWYADGLIPFNNPATGARLSGAALTAAPFNVAEGRNQPIWVDVFAPRSAPAGAYRGSYTVTSAQGSFTGSVVVNVWDFVLPLKPALKSAFLYWGSQVRQAREELLRNRIHPLTVNASEERAFIDNLGMTATDLGFWSGADGSTCSMWTAPSVAQVRTAVASHQPDLALFNYTADEIGHCTNLYTPMKEWARNLHQAGVKNLVTMAPTPALYDDGSGTGRSAVDIWVLLPLMYDRAVAEVARALNKGDEVWSYNCLVQDNYSPKWQIDFPSVNYRLQPGFINQSLSMTGLLYWRVDYWSSKPWDEVNNQGAFSSGNYPGEGLLVYPGAQVGITGVAPSMRLKWLRDGVDDYDYVELLKKQGKGARALQLARQAGPDWVSWTRDPDLVESIRRQLGDELGGPGTGGSGTDGGANGGSGTGDSTGGGTSNGPPQVVSVSPGSGSGARQTFTFTYSDPGGYRDLAAVYGLFQTSNNQVRACYYQYNPAANTLWLRADAGNKWLGPVKAGAAAVLQNTQCSIDAAKSVASGSGARLTVNVAIAFKPAFAGAKSVYMRATDAGGASTLMIRKGAWTTK
ncbi:MAG: DUF4091 domain-containing protein [Bryobacteraceae bacterium]|nr:DUF4091 domain-containing protein [Bryobacteraceae bacterium]